MSIFEIVRSKVNGWLRHKTRFFKVDYWKHQYVEWSIPKNLTVEQLDNMEVDGRLQQGDPEPLPVPSWEFYRE